MDEQPLFSNKEQAFLKALEDAGAPYLIVGLSAALIQGAPVVTQDIDLWFEQVPSDALQRALEQVDGGYVPSIMMNPPMIFGEGLSQFDIVMNIGGIGSFAEEYQNALEVELQGVCVKILPLDKIIKCKEYANRLKDRAVLPALYAALEAIRAQKK